MYYNSRLSRLALFLTLSTLPCLSVKAQTASSVQGSFEFNFSPQETVVTSKRHQINSVNVTGNSQFQSEIDAIVTSYDEQQLTLDKLYELRERISRLYIDNGYPNSGAYLPEQKINQGVAEIVVLEGQVEEINISGTDRLSESYVRSRLENLSTPISSEEILDRLQVLRLDPLIDNISGELSAGVNAGSSILNVAVTQANSFQFSSQINNQKSPAVGTNARIISLGHGNLLGFGDRFSATYENSKGSNSFNTSYSVPLNASNGRVYGGFGLSRSEIVEDAFTALDIDGSSNFFTLGFNQPLLLKSDREFSLGLEFSRQHSETTLLDSPFSLARGSNEGNTDISALRFSQEYTQRGSDSILSLRSQVNLGLDVFGATNNNDGRPDSQYVSWLGQSQLIRSLREDLPLVLRGNLQIANDNLMPLEQFRLGGFGTVRGYRRDAVLGDSGLSASAEIRLPVWRPTQGSVLQVAPFLDFGTIWNNGDEIELETSTLVSTGLGFNFDAGNGFKARLDWGVPLTAEDIDDQPVTFSLGWGI